MKLQESRINRIVSEEIRKHQRNRVLDEDITKSDEKKIKEIVGDCINELFKQLWQKNSFWKNTIKSC